MPFNSLYFAGFFPLVVLLYYAIPQRYRWLLLLVASYYFYMCWQINFAVLIVLSTLVAYFSSIQVEQATSETRKKIFLGINIVLNLGLLLGFKYLGFFGSVVQDVLDRFHILYEVPEFHWMLPVGISFYTFQIVSYSIDVYREEIPAERHLGIFALFVCFFPKVIAGPIERAGKLLPQFRKPHYFEYDLVSDGIKLMFWGFFKKVVIADRLAPLVNHVYATPTDFDGIPLVLATVFFVFQVYCDFSGYSDIAIGSARVLGFDLTTNFNRPYFSRSISDYWRRWHMTLTNWFYDYLYFPVLFRRRNWGVKLATVWAILVTFTLSGLWHGANWTFIVFGLIHGIGLSLESVTKDLRKQWTKWIPPLWYSAVCWLCMFTFLCFVDVFFRANSLAEARYVVVQMITGTIDDLRMLVQAGFAKREILSLFYGLGMGKWEIALGIILILFLVMVEAVQGRFVIRQQLQTWPTWMRWSVYYAFVAAFLLLGAFNNVTQFVYTQF